MDHHEAVRTPSTSSAHSESEVAMPTKFKLVSPLGGEALTLDWDPENPPMDTVAVWIQIVHQCQVKFPAIKAPFLNNKDRDGNDRPVSLVLPDPRKEPDPSDSTDADLTGSPKERYHKKFSLIVQVYTNAANALAKLWKGASNPDAKTWFQDRCDTQLLTLICNTTFNSAVSSVKSLNSHYAPFSSEVYGETKYEQMQLIIEQLKFKENDVFLDLGSGVGHLVLYVAGATKVKKVIGVEKAEVPANYAEKMNSEYKKWMGWFKKKHRPFELIKGDFLDPKNKHYIQEATIIFINNYAFNPDLENRIKMEIINEMETGRRVVSTKPYAPVTSAKNFNPRSANQMEAILDVVELKTVAQPTSWTDKNVPYYLHTVNQTKLQEYYDNKSKSQSSSLSSVANSRRPSISSKSNSSSSSREGSQMNEVAVASVALPPFVQNLSTSKPVKHDSHYGATTRNKWKEQINEKDGHKKRKSSPTPAWNEADREYIPPGSKKVKKESKPVVVVKKEKKESKSKSTKLPSSRAETLDYWHKKTDKLAHQLPELGGPGLERVMLPSSGLDSPADIKDIKHKPAIHADGGVTFYEGKSPLDDYILNIYKWFETYRHVMTTEPFKQELFRELQIENARNLDLKNQEIVKKQLVDVELEKGKKLVQERIHDLGMTCADTPTELLSNSKKIVADHKELTMSVSAMEAEVAHISGKTRNAVPYGPALLDNLHQLDDASLWDAEKGSQYIQYITKIALENGHMPPKEEPEPVDEAVLSPTGPRQRRTKPRNGPGRKGKQEEATSEDVERQVKEFVQVALSVDQQAKEKERRARAAGGPPSEKPSKKGVASGSGTQADAVGVPLPRTNYPGPGAYTVELRQDHQPFPQENTIVTSTN